MIVIDDTVSANLTRLANEGYGVRVRYLGWQSHVVATSRCRTARENYNACLAAIAALEGYDTAEDFVESGLGEITAIDLYRSY